MKNTLRVTEIFYSLQGESTLVGLPTVFIRLTGCPLRCQYCDTEYAFKGGENLSLQQVFDEVKRYQTQYITVTGGEPLAQPLCLDLLAALCDQGYTVSLETSGALDVSAVDQRVIKVIDIKTPDSKECDKNLWSNLECLQAHDQIKFVICSREDFDWSVETIKSHQLEQRYQVLFSPSYGQITPTELADWILTNQLKVRMQIQLHKVLWDDAKGK